MTRELVTEVLIMIESLTGRWWVFLVRGIAAVIFGILAFAWPGITLVSLTIIFGAYAFVDGILALATALGGFGGARWWALLLEGVLGLVVAFFVWTQPLLSVLTFVYAIGIWAIVTGFAEIVAGLQLRDAIENEWMYVLAGIVSIAFGILALRAPGIAGFALTGLIAVYAIVFGVLELGVSYRLNRMHAVARTLHPTH